MGGTGTQSEDTGGVSRRPDVEPEELEIPHTGDNPEPEDGGGKLTCHNELTLGEVLDSTPGEGKGEHHNTLEDLPPLPPSPPTSPLDHTRNLEDQRDMSQAQGGGHNIKTNPQKAHRRSTPALSTSNCEEEETY